MVQPMLAPRGQGHQYPSSQKPEEELGVSSCLSTLALVYWARKLRFLEAMGPVHLWDQEVSLYGGSHGLLPQVHWPSLWQEWFALRLFSDASLSGYV